MAQALYGGKLECLRIMLFVVTVRIYRIGKMNDKSVEKEMA